MIANTPIPVLLFGLAALTSALPHHHLSKRVVDSLNQAAFEEAHQRDPTATRAFSAVEIKVIHSSFRFTLPSLYSLHFRYTNALLTDINWTMPIRR